jgi:hypothetical protein
VVAGSAAGNGAGSAAGDAAGDADRTIDLSWLEAVSGGLDALADRLSRMSADARAARERGDPRPVPLTRMSTAAVVAEWLSYPRDQLAPEDVLAELHRRCRSHDRDAGPSIALLRRVLAHHEQRLAPRMSGEIA